MSGSHLNIRKELMTLWPRLCMKLRRETIKRHNHYFYAKVRNIFMCNVWWVSKEALIFLNLP